MTDKNNTVMHSYTAWITCMLPDYEAGLTLGLVKKGYSVGAADINHLVHGNKDHLAVVIAFNILSSNSEITANIIQDDIYDVICEKKYIYYSIIVSRKVESSWSASQWTWTKPKPPPVKLDKNMN